MTTTSTFTHAILGRTGREVHRLGISASYGLGAAAVEEAVERGVSYLYWGSMRTRAFGEGIRNACARGRRDKMVLVIQSYSRLGCLIGASVRRALRSLGQEQADVLLLGWWNDRPPRRIVDAALDLKRTGLVKHIALSTHQRPLVPRLATDDAYDIFHVRYNAAHRGAEREVFASLPDASAARPGIVAFTTTRWGTLIGRTGDLAGAPREVTAGDCYRFVLTNPKVDLVVTGPRDVGDLRHALDAVERGPMDPDEVAWMKRIGDEVHAESSKKSIFSMGYWRNFSAK